MFGTPSLMESFTEDREKLKNTFGTIEGAIKRA